MVTIPPCSSCGSELSRESGAWLGLGPLSDYTGTRPVCPVCRNDLTALAAVDGVRGGAWRNEARQVYDRESVDVLWPQEAS